MQQAQIQIDDNTIAVYESSGDGADVLFIHGNSVDAQIFRHQLEGDFGNKHHAVAFDLPGHGNSSPAVKPEITYSLSGYAGIVVELVRRLHLVRPIIVGWSLGGHIALEASDNLLDAAGFCIYGAPPIGIPLTMEQEFLPNPDAAVAFSPTISEEQTLAWANSFLKSGVNAPSLFSEAMLKTDGRARALLGASIMAANYKDEVQIVSSLRTPLAIVSGGEDQLVNVDYIRSLAIPSLWRGEVQIIEDAGHTPHWEKPEEFNALIAKFVGDVTQRRSKVIDHS